tara:strand:+ start:501 stop:695 length:195 start_codon:yes stop_codon:yes gene_type:complete
MEALVALAAVAILIFKMVLKFLVMEQPVLVVIFYKMSKLEYMALRIGLMWMVIYLLGIHQTVLE